MGAKKYYAVKKGKKTGIFNTWEECRGLVEGFQGAQYRGFQDLCEARRYLGEGGMKSGTENTPGVRFPGKPHAGQKEKSVPEETERAGAAKTAEASDCPPSGTLLAYVDGSYDDSLKKYAFGCVFILPDGRICTEYGNGDNEQSLQHRNVTGEMLGAMYAVRTAMASGFSQVEIRYDYEGIEKWVTGQWRSRTELTGKYAGSMREWGKRIHIRFTKVAAHSNIYYNEMADKIAKAGLREGNGVPAVRSLN